MTGFGDRLRGLFGGKPPHEPGVPARVEPVEPAASETIEPDPLDGPRSYAVDNNCFAVALYGRLRQRPGNLIFSPFSIRTALCMAYAGARGETASQMREALHGSFADEELHRSVSELMALLDAAGGGSYEMTVANSLWGQDGAPVRPQYLDLIARHYGGGMNLVDFRRAAEAARQAINLWVGEKTSQRIRDLIPPGALGPLTRLALVNAVHFKGSWVLQFDRDDTTERPFHLQGGEEVRVPLMFRQEEVRYLHGDGYQAVDLAYQGGDLSMLVLLPDRKDGLPDFEKRLSERLIRDCAARTGRMVVQLFLPRFKMTWGTEDVKDHLIALGMPSAFDRTRADFSGINGRTPPDEAALFLSAVFHKAFVEVDEKGTEAAAATAALMEFASAEQFERPPIPVFRADHPFLVAIRDRKSGTILFLGRVADPTPGQ